MSSRPDLDSPERIRELIERFYARLLADERLAPIFLDVAGVTLAEHLPLICAYWEKLLLGRDGYRRHTMNIHRTVHAKAPLGAVEFERWLAHFEATLDAGFAGPGTERARGIARRIARNMQSGLSTRDAS